MEEKAWLILAGYDGNYKPRSVVTCTEEKVKEYCNGMKFQQECEAYGCSDDDDDYESDPYPYVESYKYQEIEKITL